MEEHYILHNRGSGAIVASDAFGAHLLNHLKENADESRAIEASAHALRAPLDRVAKAARETIDAWERDGLLLEHAPSFPNPPDAVAVPIDMLWRFSLGRRSVLLRSQSADLARDVEGAVLPMLQSANAPPEDAGGSARPAVLDVVAANDGFGVFRDGTPVWSTAPYELSRFLLLREIMDILCGPEKISAHLHASAVALGGKGLILAGASGSGKSTLAMCLMGSGASIAADDHVALDVSGRAFLAFPTRPNLKEGASRVPDVRRVMGGGELAAGAGFYPQRVSPAGHPIKLSALVFPMYDAQAEDAVTPMSAIDALQRLIQTGGRISRTNASIAPLLHALTSVPVFSLAYRTTGFALSRCRDILSS